MTEVEGCINVRSPFKQLVKYVLAFQPKKKQFYKILVNTPKFLLLSHKSLRHIEIVFRALLNMYSFFSKFVTQIELNKFGMIIS